MVLLKQGMEMYHRSCIRGTITKLIKSQTGFEEKICKLEEFHIQFDHTLADGKTVKTFKPKDINNEIFFDLKTAEIAKYVVINSINRITKEEKQDLKYKHEIDDESFANWVKIFKLKNSHDLHFGFHNEDTIYLRYYHPKYMYRSSQLNPKFDEYDQKIIDLKDGKASAIVYFSNILDDLLADNITVCIVPSSSHNRNPGVLKLSKSIIVNKRVDATSCLHRYNEVQALAAGGSRVISVHLNSIRAENKHLIQGKEVLLLDDVLTTGNSLKACSNLLYDCGVKKVRCIVLGKTTRRRDS